MKIGDVYELGFATAGFGHERCVDPSSGGRSERRHSVSADEVFLVGSTARIASSIDTTRSPGRPPPLRRRRSRSAPSGQQSTPLCALAPAESSRTSPWHALRLRGPCSAPPTLRAASVFLGSGPLHCSRARVRLLCSARHDPRSASPRRTPPARHGQCEAAPGTSLHSAILRAHRQRAWTESRMCAAVNGCGPDRPPRLPPTQCGGGHRIPSHGRRADRHSRRAPSLRHVLTHRAAAAALRRGQGSRRSASSRAAPPRAAPRTSRASRRAHRRGQVV